VAEARLLKATTSQTAIAEVDVASVLVPEVEAWKTPAAGG
jgi:hypothetical protein